MKKKFGYPKEEKLKHKTEISLLFEKGKWKSSGNLRIVFFKIPSPEKQNQKIGVSVSKRYFKKATDRNRIKRLLREVYRLNKDSYIHAFGANSLSMLFWVSQKFPENFQEVQAEFLNLCNSKK